MAGSARVIDNGKNIWLRFENVGCRSKFNILMDAFRLAFPLANWDESYRAWQLPAAQLSRVERFCSVNLGSSNLQVQQEDTIRLIASQLALW